MLSSPHSRGLGLVAERIMHEDPSHQVKSGSFTYQSLHTAYTHMHGTFLEAAGLHCLWKSIKGSLSAHYLESDYKYHTLRKLWAAN